MRKITYLKTLLVAIALIVWSVSVSAQIAAWDFTGIGSSTIATTPATSFNSNLVSTSGSNTITRGTTAGWSTGSNSWRTAGFKNEGISTANTDYFQITLTPNTGYTQSLSTIDAKVTGTQTFVGTLGVTSQFAYSLDGTNFTLIGSPVVLTGNVPFTIPQIDLTGISALQNIAAGITVTLRYYASGQTSTGGWGFYSVSSGSNGLTIGGNVTRIGATVTPTFSVPTGKYITTQNIALSTTSQGATIYYTTDGTTPTISSMVYSNPIPVSSTTTLNAVAITSSLTISDVVSATYTFPSPITDITTLRSSPTSGFYQLTGQALLTFKDAQGKVKFIQDSNAGIVIYDAAGTITSTYNIGDKISNIYCTLSLYSGMLELIPFADSGAAQSTGNAVTPTIVTLSNIASYIGQLVTVKNVAITGTGNFVASVTTAFTSYPINDGTAGVLRVAYTDLPYIASAIPTTNQDITGVVNMYSTTEADLVPRTAADMVNTTVTAVNQVSSTSGITTSNGNIIFSATAGQTVEIFNAVGQKLLQREAVTGLNTIAVSARGIVLVKVDNRIAKVIL